MKAFRLLVLISIITLICGCEFDIDESALNKAIENAIKSKDPAICNSLTDPDQKDACIMGVAEGLYDAPTCTRIGNESKQDSCYGGVAVNARDFAPCAEIGDLKSRLLCMMQTTASKTEYAINKTQSMPATTTEEELAKMNALQKLQNQLSQITTTTSEMIKAFNDMEKSTISNIKG